MTLLRAGQGTRFCTVRKNANHDIATATNTTLPYQVATDDDWTWWDTGDNTKIIPDATAEIVWIGMNTQWEGSSGGRREHYFLLNLGAVMGNSRAQVINSMPGSNLFEVNHWTGPHVMATPGTDYIQHHVWHNKGANNFIYAVAATWFTVVSLGRAI